MIRPRARVIIRKISALVGHHVAKSIFLLTLTKFRSRAFISGMTHRHDVTEQLQFVIFYLIFPHQVHDLSIKLIARKWKIFNIQIKNVDVRPQNFRSRQVSTSIRKLSCGLVYVKNPICWWDVIYNGFKLNWACACD